MTRQLDKGNGLQARGTERQLVTAHWLNGGGSGYINIYALILHCEYRQVSASNPPQRQCAKRYSRSHDKCYCPPKLLQQGQRLGNGL
jgi:hypothetical protein